MNSEYELVIGLEVHAQLRTESKLFSPMATAYGAPPNHHVNEICAGMPGVLPVLNRRAVDLAIKAGLALGCEIQRFSQFARKNYFYPDLPKGYQISQFEFPICQGGEVPFTLDGERRICNLTRIHIEEDAGKLIHVPGQPYSRVDLNRAGVPLAEIVSEPEMRSPDEAVAYLKSLRAILMYLDICDGNMEEGSFRCDANCSIRPLGETELGVKVEIKNVNSFKFVKDALNYEFRRQVQCLEEGVAIQQETRLFREGTGRTESMRRKEGSEDYRYFPDPDLPPLLLTDERIAQVGATMVELPGPKRARYVSELGLAAQTAETITASRATAQYFEAAVSGSSNPRAVSNWLTTEVLSQLGPDTPIEDFAVGPAHLGELVQLIDDGVITGKIAKTVFAEMVDAGADAAEGPAQIVDRLGLRVMNDTGELETMVVEIIDANPAQVAQFRAGKTKVKGFFVGQVMRATKGKADPKMVNKILEEKLKS